jgi:hypothetical protein
LLGSLLHPDSGVASLSIALGHDASGFHLDGTMPEIPESNAGKSGLEQAIERARRDNLTILQLAQIAGSYGGLALVSQTMVNNSARGPNKRAPMHWQWPGLLGEIFTS